MKSFTLSASLLNVLISRLQYLPDQSAVAALNPMRPSKALSTLLKINQKLFDANKDFQDAQFETVKAQTELHNGFVKSLNERVAAEKGDLTEADPGFSDLKTKIKKEIEADFNAKLEEIRKSSKTHEMAKNEISVTLSDEESANLIELTEATVGMWEGLTDGGKPLDSKSVFISVCEKVADLKSC